MPFLITCSCVNHTIVWFRESSGVCPMCKIIEEKDELIARLQDEVDYLRSSIQATYYVSKGSTK